MVSHESSESSLPELRASFYLQDGRHVEISPARETEEQRLIRIFEEGQRQKRVSGDNAWDGRDFRKEVPGWIPGLSAIRLEEAAVGAFILARADAVWDKFVVREKAKQPELVGVDALSLNKLVIGDGARGLGLGRMAVELGVVPYASGNGFSAVRIDYPASSSYLREYYRELGFRVRGTISVPLGGGNNPGNETIVMELAQRDVSRR